MANHPVDEIKVSIVVNGVAYEETIPVRLTLADFLRERLGFTGTHIGCEQGVCGTCTVHLDGKAVRSCLVLAAQCDGGEVSTVEGVVDRDRLHPLQQAFRKHHALQCGYCTPGVLMSSLAILEEQPEPTEAEIRLALSGTLCRCTGYEGMIKAIQEVSRARSHSG